MKIDALILKKLEKLTSTDDTQNNDAGRVAG